MVVTSDVRSLRRLNEDGRSEQIPTWNTESFEDINKIKENQIKLETTWKSIKDQESVDPKVTARLEAQ